jgi:hypothetical protein
VPPQGLNIVRCSSSVRDGPAAAAQPVARMPAVRGSRRRGLPPGRRGPAAIAATAVEEAADDEGEHGLEAADNGEDKCQDLHHAHLLHPRVRAGGWGALGESGLREVVSRCAMTSDAHLRAAEPTRSFFHKHTYAVCSRTHRKVWDAHERVHERGVENGRMPPMGVK